MAAPIRPLKSTLTILLCSVALGACSGSGTADKGAEPPPGDIVVINHGAPAAPAQAALPQDEAAVLAPTALNADETTVVQSPPLQEGVPQPLEPVQDETVVVEAPATDGAVVVETTTVATTSAAPVHETDRLAVLEKEVAALRADYNAMMPAFNGLITTNERIQVLLKELEKQVGAQTQSLSAAQEPAAPAAAAEPASPAPAAGTPVVSGLRLGEHGDKTRLVFDVSAMTNYTTDIDNAQKVLVVTLPEAGWSGKQAVEGLKSPLVGGWRVAPRAEGGTIVTIQLKKDAKVVGTERLKATGQTPARIVIDIGIDAAPQG